MTRLDTQILSDDKQLDPLKVAKELNLKDSERCLPHEPSLGAEIARVTWREGSTRLKSFAQQQKKHRAFHNRRRTLATQSDFESCVPTGSVDSRVELEVNRSSDIPTWVQCMCKSHQRFHDGGIVWVQRGRLLYTETRKPSFTTLVRLIQ